MKILFSSIQELVPGLTADASAVGERLSMAGWLMDSLVAVNYRGQADFLLGLEVRQNRPDGWSVLGVAREVAALFGLAGRAPYLGQTADRVFDGSKIEVKVNAPEAVHRLLAVRLSGLQIQSSPEWLTQFLNFYQINSVNLPVDLSNYVMIMTGYSSHCLDASKIDGALSWQINHTPTACTTLDGSEIKLSGGELLIVDEQKVLALAGLIGTKDAAVGSETTDLILEMAVYEADLVRANSKNLNIVTEAGNRLARKLSLAEMSNAFAWLVQLLQRETKAQTVGAWFEFYPQVQELPTVVLPPELASEIAGVAIAEDQARHYLQALRFQVVVDGDVWRVTPPADRLDIHLPEDVAEEIIRLFGYQNIIFQTPSLPVLADITTTLTRDKDNLRQLLAARGGDEVLTLPLVAADDNLQTNYLPWSPVITQNAVNEDFPALRQSLTGGLLGQFLIWRQKNIYSNFIFEIGKVFGRDGDNYLEHDSLAFLGQAADLKVARAHCLAALASLGDEPMYFEIATVTPPLANPSACWQIKAAGKPLGIFYKLRPQAPELNLYFWEIALSQRQPKAEVVAEVEGKLIILDANLLLPASDSPEPIVRQLLAKVASQNLWQWEIVDQFVVAQQIRYTIRVTYRDLNDSQSKQLHGEIFGK